MSKTTDDIIEGLRELADIPHDVAGANDTIKAAIDHLKAMQWVDIKEWNGDFGMIVIGMINGKAQQIFRHNSHWYISSPDCDFSTATEPSFPTSFIPLSALGKTEE